MSRKTLYLLGILLTLLIGTLLYCMFCCPCPCKTETVVETPAKTAVASPFSVDGNGFRFQSNNNFNFSLDGSEIATPLNDSINVGIERVKAFLEANPGLSFDVVGYYLSSEKNNTTFENLGLARAEAVKNYLVGRGISAERITTRGKLKDSLFMKENLAIGPVGFSFGGKATNPIDSTSVASKLMAKPLLLYFETGESSIKLSDEDKQTIEAIKTYLKEKPDAKLLATGHTDNVGDREVNIKLSQERADFGKGKLAAMGIDAAKIMTAAKGPDVPIADNATEEGRAKNRRVEITIK